MYLQDLVPDQDINLYQKNNKLQNTVVNDTK